MLEADSNELQSDTLTVGKYRFREEAFDWGKEVLRNALIENRHYIIIDKIGPLEFQGKGLSPVVDEIISTSSPLSKELILVARDSLSNKFFEHFQIDKSKVDFFLKKNLSNAITLSEMTILLE